MYIAPEALRAHPSVSLIAPAPQKSDACGQAVGFYLLKAGRLLSKVVHSFAASSKLRSTCGVKTASLLTALSVQMLVDAEHIGLTDQNKRPQPLQQDQAIHFLQASFECFPPTAYARHRLFPLAADHELSQVFRVTRTILVSAVVLSGLLTASVLTSSTLLYSCCSWRFETPTTGRFQRSTSDQVFYPT